MSYSPQEIQEWCHSIIGKDPLAKILDMSHVRPVGARMSSHEISEIVAVNDNEVIK